MDEKIIEKMVHDTDLYPWYWLSYGEKCYAFAVVEAFPVEENDPYPTPGTYLFPDEDDLNVWIGENGTKMLTYSDIANIEEQNGGTICEFIAKAHAELMGKYFVFTEEK